MFAFIYEGVPNWAAADGVVTLHPASGPEIEVRLDEHDDRSPMCAIAQIVSDGREVSSSARCGTCRRAAGPRRGVRVGHEVADRAQVSPDPFRRVGPRGRGGFGSVGLSLRSTGARGHRWLEKPVRQLSGAGRTAKSMYRRMKRSNWGTVNFA